MGANEGKAPDAAALSEDDAKKIAEKKKLDEIVKAAVDQIGKGATQLPHSSKARTELLVKPSEEAFGISFYDAMKHDKGLFFNLIDLRRDVGAAGDDRPRRHQVVGSVAHLAQPAPPEPLENMHHTERRPHNIPSSALTSI